MRMRLRTVAVCLLAGACGGEPEADGGEEAMADPYGRASAAVGGIAWSPGLERVVAGLLVSQPPGDEAARAVIGTNREALSDLGAATREPDWRLPPPGADRPSRDDWEAAAWLAYGAARADPDGVWTHGLTAARLGLRLGEAEGAGLADLIVAFGIGEAGYLQAQRLAAAAGGGPEDAGDALRPMSEDAWRAALRAEAAAVEGRIAEMARDPLAGLGFAAEEVPETVRARPPAALFDEAAVQEAVAAAFVAAMDRRVADCAAPLALTGLGEPDPMQPNLAGRLFVRDLTTALGQIEARRCLTEGARRAALLSWRLHEDGLPERLPVDPALADPFTNEPFGYDPAARALWSAGRDRVLSDGPGQGPFDDRDPTFWLDLRPLL